MLKIQSVVIPKKYKSLKIKIDNSHAIPRVYINDCEVREL